MRGFQKHYALSALALFILLAQIALYVNDQFIRPLLGDVLVVIWVFCCLKTFIRGHSQKVALFSLLFAYAVEFAQYLQVLAWLNLEHIQVLRVVLGSTFDWFDMLAYTIGWGVIVLGVTAFRRSH